MQIPGQTPRGMDANSAHTHHYTHVYTHTWITLPPFPYRPGGFQTFRADSISLKRRRASLCFSPSGVEFQRQVRMESGRDTKDKQPLMRDTSVLCWLLRSPTQYVRQPALSTHLSLVNDGRSSQIAKGFWTPNANTTVARRWCFPPLCVGADK